MKPSAPRLLIATDKFKGVLSAQAVVDLLWKGIQSTCPQAEATCLPMADGGEGTLSVLRQAWPALLIKRVQVAGPLGDAIEAEYGYWPARQLAVITWSSAAGLSLLPPSLRHPRQATSLGVGQLITHAIQQGAQEIVLGLGGSATCDGGIGVLSQLGFSFLEANGHPIPLQGEGLHRLSMIQAPTALSSVHFTVLCDVDSPLLGKTGAAMYTKQKGANSADQSLLKRGFAHYAKQLSNFLPGVGQLPGGGAAGGAGAGLAALLGVPLLPGAAWIAEQLRIEEHLRSVDWLITGEGRLDQQSLAGKVPICLSRLAQAQGVPTIAIAGEISLSPTELLQEGVTAAFALSPLCLSHQQAMAQTQAHLWRMGQTLGGLLSAY